MANIVLGVLVFGQFVDERPVSIWLAALGFVIWLGLAAVIFFIAGGEP